MDFKGTLIEESLKDKSVMSDLTILETKTEVEAESQKSRTIHIIEIPEELALGLAEKISRCLESGKWYSDFKNDRLHYVIFPNRVFSIELDKPELYEQAKNHGLGLGIPESELDFA